MDIRIKFAISAGIIAAVIISSISGVPSPKLTSNTIGSSSKILRIGYFPNLNHVQAVIGLGHGDFQRAFPKDIKVDSHIFNSGASAIEALFANQIDVAYVGPNPTINGYIVSEGKGLRVISGAASGGEVFVVGNDAGIRSSKDLANKVFASLQLGNTQDVALRKYLLANGYKTTESGGNVKIIQANTSEILTLMLKKKIDGAWVPEPWGARLVKEANGKIFLDGRKLWDGGKFVTANIVARTDYLENNPDTVRKLLEVHVDETIWVNDHRDEAIKLFNTELKKITGKTILEDELRDAWSRIEFTYDPMKSSLFRLANDAYDLGFLENGKERPNLSGIYDLTILNSVLEKRGLHMIG
jgi:NitT/TauT family transport system substrate-binding protein